ncbi:MAG: hypothetical protein Kow00127_08720 [Bacteroidales bacterium]
MPYGKQKISLITIGIVAFLALLCHNCRSPERSGQNSSGEYLNLHDSATYVGILDCMECHYQNYLGYMSTGMGKSFGRANLKKSAIAGGIDEELIDPGSGLRYRPNWKGERLYLTEWIEEAGDTLTARDQMIDYVVGSGQHTNSHIWLSGSYAYQAPFTFYTQDSILDFPPGFEGGHNSRFSRKIGLECMSCHNALPGFVLGSENKYSRIPQGIDCERCHGPGSVHSALMRKSRVVDTSKHIDYSIVTPTDLPPERQNDICARCHLQGTMVLMPGKSFYDFRPGMDLDSVMAIFMPSFEEGGKDLIMASHYERMVLSRCYTGSDGSLTCLTCHKAHQSHLETPQTYFNSRCTGCHNTPEKNCHAPESIRDSVDNSCVVCHMPETGTRDIPHVRIHDHRIAVHTPHDKTKDYKFLGLKAVNLDKADSLTMARGYLREYETYHPDPTYLDSAFSYLKTTHPGNEKYYFQALINYFFLKKDYNAITRKVTETGAGYVLDHFVTEQSYSNDDAWTAYRIGEALLAEGRELEAGYFLERAAGLAPFNLEFQNKLGAFYVSGGKLEAAARVFERILQEDEKFVPALVNLAFVETQTGRNQPALMHLEKASSLDPTNTAALANMIVMLHSRGQKMKANKWMKVLESVARPGDEKVSELNNILRKK